MRSTRYPTLREHPPCISKADSIGERRHPVAARLREAQVADLHNRVRTLAVKAGNWKPRKPNYLLHLRQGARLINVGIRERVRIVGVLKHFRIAMVGRSETLRQIHAQFIDTTRGANQSIPIE